MKPWVARHKGPLWYLTWSKARVWWQTMKPLRKLWKQTDDPKNKQGLFIQSLLWQRCQLPSIALCGAIQRYGEEWENFIIKLREGFRNALIRQCWYGKLEIQHPMWYFGRHQTDSGWPWVEIKGRYRKTGSCWLAMLTIPSQCWQRLWCSFSAGCHRGCSSGFYFHM